MHFSALKAFLLVVIGMAAGAAFLAVATVPAHADAGRSAVCTAKPPWADGAKNDDTANLGVQQWMNEQLAAGKTNFITVINGMQRQSLCAW